MGHRPYSDFTDLVSILTWAVILIAGSLPATVPPPCRALEPSAALPRPGDFVHILSGSFTMGDSTARCGDGVHTVTLTRDFELGCYEVTNRECLEMLQWAYDQGIVIVTDKYILDNLDGGTRKLMELKSRYAEIQYDGEGRFYLRPSPSPWAREAYPDGYDPADHPVKELTWYGAAAYCDWLNLCVGLPRSYDHATWECNDGDPYGAVGYRLPTDAEWEYAARFGEGGIYPWGDEKPDCRRTNVGGPEPCVGWSSAVGAYPSAPAVLQLYDMAGNLWEWCQDWRACELPAAPQTDPCGPPDGDTRIMRGGNWRHGDGFLRNGFRHGGHPFSSYSYTGLRVARTVPTPDAGK